MTPFSRRHENDGAPEPGAKRLRLESVDLWDDGVECRVHIDGKHVHTERHKSAFWASNNAMCWVEDNHPELLPELRALCAEPW